MASPIPPSYSNPDPHAIAVVGMSICAPGGEEYPRGVDVEEFWEMLATRRDPMITVPKDRWNAEAFHGSQPGRIRATKGGFIPDLSYGDLSEFGVTPAEAAQVGTPQLVLLHQAFNALQRSGVDYRHTKTGVYVGVGGSGVPFEMDIVRAGAYYSTGMAMSIAANRISYVFDLMGPSVPVDTACSSSLVAIHLAIQAIRNGECDQAVIAGINFVSNPLDTVALSQLGLLSPDGHSKSFSDDADGCARADVANAVVIKRHDLAIRDRDNILATVVGTSLTTCGNIMGSLTTPNPEAHTMAIHSAYLDAKLEPHQADFIELHGTGTPVGDMLETNAAGAAFAKGRNGREIIIGSVKSNIGHTETGSYLSALVKVIMMLQHKKILPNGYFKKPSSKINFKEYNLRVPTEVEDFKVHDEKLGRIVSVSNFGYGGAGGHSVVREHEDRPELPDVETLKSGPFVFTMGGLTPRALNALIDTYKAQYANADPLALSEHLGLRTRQMPWRSYAVAESLEAASFEEPTMVDKIPSPLILCFSGQGPQHWQQGRVLMTKYTAFRESIITCDGVYQTYTGKSFLNETGLFSDSNAESPLEKSLTWPADVISVAITFFQIAVTDLLKSLNIKPAAIVGHSIGETAVLYASGAMPRDMVVEIAIARGRAMSLADNIGGTMVAISGCDEKAVNDYVDAVSSLAKEQGKAAKGLYLATFNSSTDIGVSGSEVLVDTLSNYINTWVDGATARKLRVSTAVHSPFVDICEETYRAELTHIFSKHDGPFLPKLPVMSTVTGDFVNEAYSVEYMWRNLRQPVLFSTAVPKLVEHFGEHTTFLEVSPHPVLSSYIQSMGAAAAFACAARPPSTRQLASGAKNVDEHFAFLQAMGRLLVSGVNSVNFSILNGCSSQTIDGPPYPFQWKHTPIALNEPGYLRRLLPPTRPLNSTRLRVSPSLPEPWIGDHIVDQSNLIPASAFIEMALEFEDVTQVWNCHFDVSCTLDPAASPVTLEVAKDGTRWSVKSSTGLETLQGDLQWTRSGPLFDTVHAYGKLGYGKPALGPNAVTKVDVDAVLNRCFARFEKEEIYTEMRDLLQFGPEFSRIQRAAINENEVICWITGHVEGVNKDDYAFHPAIMDATFQSGNVFNLLYDKISTGRNGRVLYLPYTLRRAYRNDGSTGPLVLPAEFRTYTKLAEWTLDHFTLDIYVLDDDNSVVYTFEGLQMNFLNKDTVWPTESYMNYWQPRALPSTKYEDVIDTLDSKADATEAVQLLNVLDYLAIQYTAETIRSLPADYSTDLYDRQCYFQWAKKQAERLSSIKVLDIQTGMEDKYTALFELIRRIAPVQKDILRTSTAAVEVMFRDTIMSEIYELPPFVGEVFAEVASKFVAMIKDAVAAGKKVIRVLEVGAGTGRMTALLGQALVDAKIDEICHVDYVSTDISISLAQESTAKSPWPTMTPKALDLSVPIAQQGFDAHSFDIVAAFDVLHAIPDINDTLEAIQQLLSPGGHIAIIELDGRRFAEGTPGTVWMDYVFGSFSEWFGVLKSRPGANHCSLTPAQWTTALESAGFSDTSFLLSPGSQIIHMAFISQGRFTPSPRHLAAPPSVPQTIYGYEAGKEIEMVEFTSTLDSKKPHTLWLYADTNSYKLLGIARSIRQEFGLWKIMLVLFDPSWTVNKREAFIRAQLMTLQYVDAEVLVDAAGNMSVPRVVKAPRAPQVESRNSNPVLFNQSNVWRAYPSPLAPTDVEVSISFINVSCLFADSVEFTGRVTSVGVKVADKALVGQTVFGIAPGRPGSFVVCDHSQIALLPAGMDEAKAAVLGARLAFLTCINKKTSLATMEQPRVLLHAGSSSPAALLLYEYLRIQGIDAIVTADDALDASLFPGSTFYKSNEYDVWVLQAGDWAQDGIDIAFNFSSDKDVARETVQILSKTGLLLDLAGNLPDALKHGQNFASIDSSAIKHAAALIEAGLKSLPVEALTPGVSVFTLSQLKDAQKIANIKGSTVVIDVLADANTLSVLKAGVLKGTDAFDPRATYIVIGGVGGLGTGIARCLVEHGARHIVLTSRSGEASLKVGRLVYQKKILNALRSIPGVTIDVVASDVMSLESTKALFSGERRVAGVFYLPVVLEDTLFSNMTSEKYWKPVTEVKVKGLQTLVEVANPASLDFLVVASTAAIMLGSEGQANYTSANVAMEVLAATLPNTVTISVPALTDGGVYVRSVSKSQSRNAALDKFRELGFSTLRVAEHCVDAIWSLNTPAANPLYILPMNWKGVMDVVPPDNKPFVRHLLVKESAESKVANASKDRSVRGACASVLSMEVSDIEDIIPLASYGLDSLTSVRLSGILQQHFDISVTQMQLLSSYMTVKRLEQMQEEQLAATNPEVNGDKATDVNGDADTLGTDVNETVVLLNGTTQGTPLFVLHGAGGGISVLRKLAREVKCPLYGVQDTPEAPVTGSLQDLAHFYLERIREKQAHGPYRLAGFSFGTSLALCIALELRNAGEKIDALIMLDAVPSLFYPPQFYEWSRKVITDNKLREEIMNVVIDMSTSGSLDDTEDVISQFDEHFAKKAVGESGNKWVARFCRAYAAHFMMGVRAATEMRSLTTQGWPTDNTVLIRGTKGVGSRPQFTGVSHAFDMDNWAKNVKVYELPGTHFGILNPVSGISGVINEACGLI